MIYSVKFPCGRTMVVNRAENEADAMSKAFMHATRPVYCYIYERIVENSNAPVGDMGLYFPPSAYPVSAERMKEVYVNGGYCIIPA